MGGTTLGSVPVFLRVGDGEEHEIGTIAPEVSDLEVDADGVPFVMVSMAVAKLLPGFLRRAADEMEAADAQ
jgi:hypothetical protein